VSYRTLILPLAALSVGACIVQAQHSAPTASEALQSSTRQLELPDGLRVVLEQAPDFGATAAALVVGAGSAQDPIDKAGLAHLTEHLAFEATHAGVSFRNWARNLDPNLNASTWWDQTTYYALEDVDNLEQMLVFLNGVVHEPLAGIGEKDFRREWHAVSNERRWRTEEGTPGQGEGWLMSAAFAVGDPYARQPAGTPGSLARLSLDDVRAFTAAHYQPANSTLVVAAPQSLDALQGLIERIAGGTARVLNAPPPRRLHLRTAKPAPPTRIQNYEAEVPTPTLWVGWVVPSTWDTGGDIAPLMARLGAISAWRTIDRRDDDIGHVETGVLPGDNASLVFARVALKTAAHPADSVRAVAEEMAGSLGKLTGIGDSIDIMSHVVGTEYVYREESLLTHVRDAALSYQAIGIPTFLGRRGERMSTLSASAVSAFAHSYLTADKAHAVLIRPRDRAGTPAPPAPEPPSFVRAVATDAEAPAAPPDPAASKRRPAPSQPHADPVLGTLETHVLANGLTVILLPRAGTPFHTALLGFKGGLAHASPPGVTTAMDWSRQWSHGSPRVWGIDYGFWVDDAATIEQLRSTGSDVAMTLKQLREHVGFSVFWPPQRFNERVEVYERETQTPEALLERALARATFGAQPLGAQPSAKELQRIRPAEVMKWVDKIRRPGNAALVIVGDFEPKAALAAARAELEGWGANAGPGPIGDPAPAESIAPTEPGQLLVEHRPAAEQPTLHIKCLLPRATPATFAARTIFVDTLKKAMRAEFREEIGGSYSVRGDVSVIPGGTDVLDLSADVDYAALPEVLKQIRHLLAGAGRGNPPEPTRRETAGLFRLKAATTPAMAQRLFEMWNLGWPLDTLDHLHDDALAVTDGELAATAANCRDNWVIGLLGDEPRLRAAWAAAGD
jgi:zinc protease